MAGSVAGSCCEYSLEAPGSRLCASALRTDAAAGMTNFGGFTSLHDLWVRARVSLATIEKLAAADAFRSVRAKLGSPTTGLDRRQALWEAKALTAKEPLPLFAWSQTRESGNEPAVALPEMALSEHVVNDYQTLRLSLKAHPMNFLGEDFTAARVCTCNDVRTIRDGARVRVAGIVLVRQRPGSAKGVVFMTI
jgi:error-prone DNA polymerase